MGGDSLHFSSSSLDFIVSAHQVQNMYDPIGFLCEAARVVKPGGDIASILPRYSAQEPKRTVLADLLHRHYHPMSSAAEKKKVRQGWLVEDMIEMCRFMNLHVVAWQEKDDKVGNGFSVVVVVPNEKSHINC